MPRAKRPDSWYRHLFGFRVVVAAFLARFAGEWVNDLDLATLHPATTALQSRGLKERFADRVWQARRRDGQGEVYVAFEFQARPDPRMPFRIMEYQALLYGELSRERVGRKERFPPVVAVVVYNGEQPWLVPTDTAEALGVVGTRLAGAVARVTHDLVDVLRVSCDPTQKGDLGTALVLLQQARSRRSFVAALGYTIRVLDAERLRGTELEETFVRWVCDELTARWTGREKAAMLRDVHDLDQALSAIEQRFKQWATEAARARKEGLQQGMQKGLQRGLVESLLVVLRARFGRVSRKLEARLRGASVRQLRQWLRRASTAESLDAVFGPNR